MPLACRISPARTVRVLLTCTIIVFLTLALGAHGAARPGPFVVNINFDLADANPGDGVCEVSSGGGACSLRAAVQEVNARGGGAITFDAGGAYDLTSVGDDTAAALGDLDITTAITITGHATPTTIDAAAINDDVFRVLVGGSLTLVNLTITGGNPSILTNKAGGITNLGSLTLTGTTVSGNQSLLCGGIGNDGGTATITNSTITNNHVLRYGGGVCTSIFSASTTTITNSTISDNRIDVQSGVSGAGGGVYSGTGGGTLTINASTIARNRVVNSSTSSAYGGGLGVDGGTATVTNSTLSDNAASDSGQAIFTTGGALTLTNDTIAFNAPAIEGRVGDVRVRNTIFANGGGHNCPLFETFTSLDYNLSDDASCNNSFLQPHDLDSRSANLTPLADFGGPTQTRMPLAPSAAIEAIPAPGNGSPATDQRGVARPQGARFDIGAVEYVPPAPLPSGRPGGAVVPPPAPAPLPQPRPGGAVLPPPVPAPLPPPRP